MKRGRLAPTSRTPAGERNGRSALATPVATRAWLLALALSASLFGTGEIQRNKVLVNLIRALMQEPTACTERKFGRSTAVTYCTSIKALTTGAIGKRYPAGYALCPDRPRHTALRHPERQCNVKRLPSLSIAIDR